MIRTALFASALALLLAAAPAGAARVRPDDVCSSARLGRTIASQGWVAVRVRHGYHLACFRGRAAAFLAQPSGYDPPSHLRAFRIAGDWVAWAEVARGRDHFAIAQMCNVRDHRGVTAAPTGDALEPDVVGVAVTSFGALVFGAVDDDHPNSSREIVAVDAGGRRRVASGAGLDLGSLAVGGPFAYWRDEGAAMSATLRGTGARAPSRSVRLCARPNPAWRI